MASPPATLDVPAAVAQPQERGDLATILVSRLALNMQARVIYPFLPAIARGLGLPLQTTALLLTVRAAANLSSPVYGALSDRYGRRVVMLAGLGLLLGGAALALTAPGFGLILVAFALLSLSKAVYDPAVLAYVGDSVPYEHRARALGLLSLMWPTAWLIGVPTAGFLITAYGWRSPFVMVALLGLLSLALMLRAPHIGRPSTDGSAAIGQPFSLRAIGPTAWLALLVTLLQVLASENVYIVYAAWMETQFGLTVAALGVVSLVICAAEFTAEGACIAWVDRIGKRRAITGGLLGSVVAYLLLPHVADTLGGALLGLALVWLAWDFTIVSTLPLISQLAPEARGSLMALNVAAMAAARLISSLIAIPLWTAGGLPLTTTVSAACVAVAVVVLRLGVREGA